MTATLSMSTRLWDLLVSPPHWLYQAPPSRHLYGQEYVLWLLGY